MHLRFSLTLYSSVIRINRILGAEPTDQELNSYLEAYFGDRLSSDHREHVIANLRKAKNKKSNASWFENFVSFFQGFFDTGELHASNTSDEKEVLDEAHSIADALSRSTEELSSVLEGLNGGYVKPAPGGGKKYVVPFAPFECEAISTRHFQIYFVTAQVYFRQAVTFTRWILTECQVLALGREGSGPQQKSLSNTRHPMKANFQKRLP